MGVEVIVNGARQWQEGDGLILSPEPDLLLPLPAAEDTLHFASVRAVVALAGGGTAVADAGSRQVLVFGSDGRLARRIGRPGDGPGELRGIWTLFSCDDGSLVVGFQDQMDFFDADGAFRRRLRSSAGGHVLATVGVAGDCERFLVRRPTGPRSSPEDRFRRVHLAWTDTSFTDVRPVAEAIVAETHTVSTELGPLRLPMPWTPYRQAFALGPSEVVVGFGRTAEVRIYRTDGPSRRIVRWPVGGEAVTAADRRRYEDRRTEYLAGRAGDPDASATFPPLRDIGQAPTTKPVFDGLIVDDEGRVWLRRFPPESLGGADERPPPRRVHARAWTVIDTSGAWLGDVEMPAGLEPHAVRDGRIWGVLRDPLGVERVGVFEILPR